MTKFAERGRAKADARQMRGRDVQRARFARRLDRAAIEDVRRLEARIDEGTRERLRDFCADAPTPDQAQAVLTRIARWALGQSDPAAAINQQLNEAEAAEDARPKVDPAWLPSKTEATENAPEAAQENA